MIVLHLYCNCEDKIKAIATALLNEKLARAIDVDFDRERYLEENGQAEITRVHKLTCLTQTGFFDEINELLRQRFPGACQEIYSIPVVHMDWDRVRELKITSSPLPDDHSAELH
ncbi:hypothetical protein LAG90_19155 [Marinilongibacter aquaticus]|uniref:hypothetical protein n=1 Tax=Marinilongibacter aquaticus TaxID=2975157 RepID=UPI0021BD4C43|nr:hypothetical protein [Marinilongibacter aquaticus]UBM58919.1 hypothetical protein LAG90_19155 [Marinilongibacter aquaticus]